MFPFEIPRKQKTKGLRCFQGLLNAKRLLKMGYEIKISGNVLWKSLLFIPSNFENSRTEMFCKKGAEILKTCF